MTDKENERPRILITEETHTELTAKLEALANEYPELSFLFMVEDENGDWSVSGNACVKCSEETLIDFCTINGITHRVPGQSSKVN